MRPDLFATDLVNLDFRLIANELGIPTREGDGAPAPIGHAVEANLKAATIEVARVKVGEDALGQYHWLLFDVPTGRIYEFDCQYPPDQQLTVMAACQAAANSLAPGPASPAATTPAG
jgi:hypothetical protein